MRRLILLVACLSVSPSPLRAEDPADWAKSTKISGYAFGDLYYVAGHHDDEIDGRNGFWFRRIYLTFDHKLSEKLDARLRFEGTSPGDFTSSAKIAFIVKDGYIRWKGGDHSVYLGISSTPTWGVVEKEWGYRAVEKTPLDLQKLGSSRDFGVGAKGKLGSEGKLRYHVMLGNGASNKGETNNGKKVFASLGFYPSDSFIVEVYGDFESRPGDTDRTTYQAFATYKGGWGRLGLQAVRQQRDLGDGQSLELDVASAFAVFKLGDKANVLARYDRMFDPNPDGSGIAYLPFDDTAKSSLALVGVDIKVHESFSLIPNVEYVVYDGANGQTPESDIVVRGTFFYRF